ncbi:HEAT repeat domain-containing protein [Halopseudomonas nanhaiensis]|uniref:HEAT repeat domain-containing protein n=1 Tax=Halopseudomonas nanhaiensis TaxID=2830842 RepID=UPI001CC0DE71|nr:HEAT repeat domain-containing protein [Halopseudomonas nanhaiensis]UAW99903.1 HEAT repeat domain-containing protein [Halopseudomonas nanhaiensis]
MFSEPAVICPAWVCQSDLAALWRAWLPQQPTLRLAVYSAVALALITTAVMLQILVLSDLGNRRARRRKAFNETWRPYLALCSISDPVPTDAPTLKARDRLWWLLQWNRLQQQLRGSARIRMNATLVAFGMEDHVLRLLGGGVRKRLIALTSLRYFGTAAHWDLIAALLSHRNAVIALAAARTLVEIDPTRAMTTVLPMARQRMDWALPRLTALCQSAGPDAVTAPLLAVMYAADEAERQRLGSLMILAQPRLTGPWARAQLEQPSTTELLEVALRCLGAINDPRDRPRVLQHLDHDDPNVRLLALRAFQNMAGRDDEARLIDMLGDRSWWVRQAAADAVAALPGYTDARLTELVAQVEDRYGKDALRRVLAERRE